MNDFGYQTAAKNETNQFFYLMVVLLMLIFSVCIDVSGQRSIASTPFSNFLVIKEGKESGPVLSSDFAYCSSELSHFSSSKLSVCKDERGLGNAGKSKFLVRNYHKTNFGTPKERSVNYVE